MEGKTLQNDPQFGDAWERETVSVIKNRSTARGREFWDHVEAISQRVGRKTIEGQLADEFAASGEESYSEWLFEKAVDLTVALRAAPGREKEGRND